MQNYLKSVLLKPWHCMNKTVPSGLCHGAPGFLCSPLTVFQKNFKTWWVWRWKGHQGYKCSQCFFYFLKASSLWTFIWSPLCWNRVWMGKKLKMQHLREDHQSWCWCRFRLRTDRTSAVNLKKENILNKDWHLVIKKDYILPLLL